MASIIEEYKPEIYRYIIVAIVAVAFMVRCVFVLMLLVLGLRLLIVLISVDVNIEGVIFRRHDGVRVCYMWLG